MILSPMMPRRKLNFRRTMDKCLDSQRYSIKYGVMKISYRQMLTLYTTPVMYLYVERFRLWMKGLRPNRAAE